MAEKILPADDHVPSKLDQAIIGLEGAHSLLDSLYTLELTGGIESLCKGTLAAQLDASMKMVMDVREAIMSDIRETATPKPAPVSSYFGDALPLINDGIAAQAAIAGARRLFHDLDGSSDGDAEWQIEELLSSAYQRIEDLCLKLEPKAA